MGQRLPPTFLRKKVFAFLQRLTERQIEWSTGPGEDDSAWCVRLHTGLDHLSSEVEQLATVLGLEMTVTLPPPVTPKKGTREPLQARRRISRDRPVVLQLRLKAYQLRSYEKVSRNFRQKFSSS